MPHAKMIWFGTAALAGAFVYCSYGVWNAYHPRVRTVEVAIRNLPAPWTSRTLVQISDVHLGAVLDQGFLSGVVDKINAQSPDVVLITGTVRRGDPAWRRWRAARPDPAPLGRLLRDRNHEGFLGVANAVAAVRTTQARVLSDEMVEIDGLQSWA